MKQGRPGPIASTLLCAALQCAPALAQDLSEREFLTEFPTVLSASRLRQNVADAPQAVTVIDQDTIRASGVREIPELFRMVPGFNVSYSTHVKGLQPIVSYHGLGREFFSRLQVLIDGRSMNNATLGGVDWNDFPLALDDIERIEVVRGPSTRVARHRRLPRHDQLHHQAPVAAARSLRERQRGQRRASSTAWRATPAARQGFDFRITAEHQSDNGFTNVPDSRGLDFATVRADWQLDRTDSLMLQAGATNRDERRGNGKHSPIPRAPRASRPATRSSNGSAASTPTTDSSAQLYYYRFKLNDQFQTDPTPAFNNEQFPVDDSSTVRRTDFEVQQTFSVGPAWRGVWGGSVREDVAEAPLLLQQTERLRVAPALRTRRVARDRATARQCRRDGREQQSHRHRRRAAGGVN